MANKLEEENNSGNLIELNSLDFLPGGGEMGKLIRSKDWSKTPLGSPDTWPQSLRTTVSLCIASNFPISITWGPQRVQIYNDGYWPITGAKHPTSMGQDFKECWLPAWPVIGQAFEEASLGQTRFLENQRIFIDRYGYLEETFFTFSFSPILDEFGGVGGLFHPVIELTQQTLAERRLNILRAVADNTVNARTAEEAFSLILACLKDFELDLPFVLLYSVAADGKEANLEGHVGVEKDSPLTTAKINLEDHSLKSWPFTEVIQTGKGVKVKELAKIFGRFSCGPYDEPPAQAMVFPVTLNGTDHSKYILVTGVSSRRGLDEKYLSFYDLLTAAVTNALIKARAYEEERKKAESLAEIDKAKTVFFSNISHEFRTPLTLMLSPLEELLNQKKNNFSEIDKGNIETTHRNAIRLLKLVNTLLDFSRIESGRVQAIFSLVDIVVLTKNLVSNFRSLIEKAGLQLIVIADSIFQPVYVDRQMWEKIVFNLLSNAFKYTLEGKITVELLAEKDFVVLKVRDTGVGIPENELPKMFERFHRVRNVTGRTHEGTGIGLSLIKELVQMHHGTINVESELNAGSVFTVKIPTGKKHIAEYQISKKEIDSDEISSAIYVDEIEALLKTGKPESLKASAVKEKNTFPTILVVDDNADMREHISSILSNCFNVITAHNGMDALQKMKETIPAVVLSDIMMPVMDGFGLLKEIRSNKSTANIPVIFLTARAGEESKIEGLETGADDYLVKPFSAKELLSRLRAQIKMVELRQSLEGKVRNLFMEAPAIICVLRGPQHVFELANEMYLQLIGKRDILDKTVREVMPELEGQGYLELLDNVYATGESYTGKETPAQINKGNGKLEEAYFNFVYQPIHNNDGEIDGVLLHGIDVTEQVLARKKIEENKNQLQNVFLNAPACISILEGPEHIFVLANRAYEKLTSRKAEDLLGKSASEVFPELIGTGALELHDNVFETGESFNAAEYAVMLDLKNDGVLQQCYFNFFMEPLRNDSGEIYAVMSMAYDITEQVKARKKIEENEKRFSNLLMESPFAFAILQGKDMVVSMANDAIKQVWGKGNDIEGKSLVSIMPEIEEQGFAALLEQVYTTGEPFYGHEELVKLQRNGIWEDVYFNFIYQPYREADETISGVTIIANEVTTQAIASKKIAASEQNVSRLFMQAPAVIGVLRGPQHVHELANEMYLQLAGNRDVIGKAVSEVFPELKAQGFFELLDNVYATGEPFIGNELLTKLDRGNGKLEEMYFSFVYQPTHNDEGEIDGIFVHGVDVTEQVLARRKVEESEKRFRSLADQSPMIVYLLEPDAEATMSYFNRTWLDYTGQKFEEATGRDWYSVVHPDDLQRVLDIYVPAFLERKPYTLPEVRLRRHDSEYRWHLLKGNPRYFHEGEFIGFVGVGFDIHEQKIKEERKDEFISLASHEMKTPLTSAKAYLQFLERSLNGSTGNAVVFAKKASQSIQRLDKLISELLDVSKIQQGKLNYAITSFNFNDMIDETVENMQLILSNHTIIKTGKVYIDVVGDKDRLQQVVINLLSNAIKYSPGAEKVLIDVEQEDSMIKVSVKDYGIGIAKHSLNKIFDKYHRVEEHALQFQGLGIGLFISNEIIQRHKGKLWAESEPGEGSKFYFTLPVVYNE